MISLSSSQTSLVKPWITQSYSQATHVFLGMLPLFSAPEPKAQVHYCYHALSVRPSLTFHIFDFSSETAAQNSMKLDRKQELNVLYQVCVFRADRASCFVLIVYRYIVYHKIQDCNHTCNLISFLTLSLKYFCISYSNDYGKTFRKINDRLPQPKIYKHAGVQRNPHDPRTVKIYCIHVHFVIYCIHVHVVL